MLVYVMTKATSQNPTEERKESPLTEEKKGELLPSFYCDESGKQEKERFDAIMVPRKKWWNKLPDSLPKKKKLETEVFSKA